MLLTVVTLFLWTSQMCGKGYECTIPPCRVCTACAPGKFKSAKSTEACEECPANTYRQEIGATELGNCIDCLGRSGTSQKKGQSSWKSCICDSIYYRIRFEGPNDQCQVCPPGLHCNGSAGVAVVTPGSIWSADDFIFRLESCPTGYSVYYGSDIFNAELQKCEPCGKGKECTLDICTTCLDCAAGYYKAVKGPIACTECPENTYR